MISGSPVLCSRLWYLYASWLFGKNYSLSSGACLQPAWPCPYLYQYHLLHRPPAHHISKHNDCLIPANDHAADRQACTPSSGHIGSLGMKRALARQQKSGHRPAREERLPAQARLHLPLLPFQLHLLHPLHLPLPSHQAAAPRPARRSHRPPSFALQAIEVFKRSH